jgi:CTP-dependent riboflavin kinase
MDANMNLTGTVITGTGAGAGFVSLPWVLRWLEERLELRPYPGTLNLALDARAARRWRRMRDSEKGVLLQPPTSDYCDARWFPVRVADRLPGVIVLPVLDGYPSNQLEIVSPYHLRSSLSLEDGATVTVDLSHEAIAGKERPR